MNSTGAVQAAIRFVAFAAVLALSAPGCSGGRPLWHDQALPSGKTVKVTSFNLVWGVEHDERDVTRDSFALEFVSANAAADQAAREQEAREVFELIRPASELWGFKSAVVSGFPAVERKGRYEVFTFTRGAGGQWSFTRQQAKVFVTDP
jgi:hypothetical protein